MRFIICTAIVAIGGFFLGRYLPWWSVAIAGFFGALLIRQRPGMSFLSGFTGIFLCWGFLSWRVSSANGHLLAPKVAAILPLGGSVVALIAVAALVGALASGLASLTAALLVYKKPAQPV